MYGIVSKGKTDFLKLNSAMIKWDARNHERKLIIIVAR